MTEEKCKQIFRSMDQDGTGSLDAAEAHRGFKQLDEIHPNHVEKLITVFDRDDGSLNYGDLLISWQVQRRKSTNGWLGNPKTQVILLKLQSFAKRALLISTRRKKIKNI